MQSARDAFSSPIMPPVPLRDALPITNAMPEVITPEQAVASPCKRSNF